MEVKLYKPENPILRKYIECFYTLKRHSKEKSIRYAAFPSLYSMVCLSANCKTETVGNLRTHSYRQREQIETSLVCNFGRHAQICYQGEADEIVIYFKPLGINAFLENELREYKPTLFSEFEPFGDYIEAMGGIFALDGDAKRIRSLEDYWLSKLRGFEHPFLQNAVDAIMTGQASASITELAGRYGISRPTLIKHFYRHLCTTPSQFRKIVRFRKAMKHHKDKFSCENLSDISQNVDYFDQSHMVKDFKSLTRYSPKNFFSKLSSLEDGQINWLFL